MGIIALENLLKTLDSYDYKELHIHHTWKPSHSDFTGVNHIRLQRGMRNYHMKVLGWSDIGQHVSLAPDGQFIMGRDFGKDPASIKGFNVGAFAVEMIGNFDAGHDKLEGEQLNSIVSLAKYFDKKGVYIRFHREKSSKTCPGSSIDKDWFMRQVKKPKLDWKQEAVQWLLDEGYLTDEEWLNKVNDPFPLWAQAIVLRRVIDREK